MKSGFDFISRRSNQVQEIHAIENKGRIKFPSRFETFFNTYSIDRKSIQVERRFDEKRGIDFPIEAILFLPSKRFKNPLYFNYFREEEDLLNDLQNLIRDDLWLNKGLIIIGYGTMGEKICLGIKQNIEDEIWLVLDDSISKDRYVFLAKNIFEFIEGLVSKH